MRMRFSFLIVVILLIALVSAHAASAETGEHWVAKAVSVQGTVEARRVNESQWSPVKLNDTYSAGDTIRVLERSRAEVAVLDQSVIRLRENTTITFEGVKDERTSLVDLLAGAVHFFSHGPRSLDVQTPFVVAGIKGTEGFVDVEGDKTFLSIFEGTVLATNPSGGLTLTAGQSAVAEAGKAPVLRLTVNPRDAVRWALYYPPVIYLRPDDFPGGADWQVKVREAISFSLKGDLQKALGILAQIPPDVRDPRVFAYRAQLLLAVGNVDQARTDIARALQLAPNDSGALALYTVISVVQNEKDKALEMGQQAVAAAPHSSTALIALSYAQQASFDLEGARSSLEKAVQLDPANALAWARLADLRASFGDLNQALKAAKQAAALEPDLALTQTVLGFAYLTRVQTGQAKEAFTRAIALDQADPLPRLGLGLAVIRDGDLHAGARDIEIAAGLDPNNSLVRSYLGKSYYEEKITALTDREYATAKALDPKDPTPWFYDAIQKQTTNRPVDALHDLQTSIELNDNRAVYRSRLLLDSDLAARSASLGRIYSDLGFQQLALVEGWKSVAADPTNYSAHRFLSDSYATLPRHEIARVSELLQSQLLQPINITPIQPRLAESNLFLVSSGGPGRLSFNEFNPLFMRNGVNLQSSGVAGSDNTYAGEGVLAGIYRNASFSAGGFHYSTDGFRQNADQEDTIADGFTQWELSPDTSLQAEYRHRDLQRGDLRLRFFPDDFLPGLRSNTTTDTYRFGLRHDFSPQSISLGSFVYQQADFSDKTDQLAPPVNFIDVKTPQDSASGEFEHLFRSRYVDLIGGMGYFNISGTESRTISIAAIGPQKAQNIFESQPADVQHTNMYLYSYLKPLPPLTFTVGMSGDLVDGNGPELEPKAQPNPKFGITWTPLAATTIRAAVFRTLKRTLITNQTLEPTQVAGFNQFFDDVNETEAWCYGGAIDQKLGRNVFGGLEFFGRNLSSPFLDVTNPSRAVLRDENENEYIPRSYLFWTPHPLLALTSEYMFERFTSQGKTDQPIALNTNRLPLGVSVFLPSGWSTFLRGTYFNQSGDFVLNNGTTRSGSDNFWTLDAGLSYRLPERYGFVRVGGTNLLDQHFRYFERDINNPSIRPDRGVFGEIIIALP